MYILLFLALGFGILLIGTVVTAYSCASNRHEQIEREQKETMKDSLI
jgi:hypothetical protein